MQRDVTTVVGTPSSKYEFKKILYLFFIVKPIKTFLSIEQIFL